MTLLTVIVGRSSGAIPYGRWGNAMKNVRIAAAQTVEFREDLDAALNCAADLAADAQAQGAVLLCFPEGFLQGYLTEETSARRCALDLASPEFEAVLNRLPKTGLLVVDIPL